MPAPTTSVLTGTADAIAEGVARSLFVSAPVVVVAKPGRPAELASAASTALRAHAPLLLTSGPTAMAARSGARTMAQRSFGAVSVVSTALRTQIKGLDPRAVLAVGVAQTVLAARLPGIHVATSPAMLPVTKAPAPPT